MAQTPATTTSRVREGTAAFSKSHDVDAYFAEDAEYDVLPLGQHYQGKEQIKGLFRVFYQDAFSPAAPAPTGPLLGKPEAPPSPPYLQKTKHNPTAPPLPPRNPLHPPH